MNMFKKSEGKSSSFVQGGQRSTTRRRVQEPLEKQWAKQINIGDAILLQSERPKLQVVKMKGVSVRLSFNFLDNRSSDLLGDVLLRTQEALCRDRTDPFRSM